MDSFAISQAIYHQLNIMNFNLNKKIGFNLHVFICRNGNVPYACYLETYDDYCNSSIKWNSLKMLKTQAVCHLTNHSDKDLAVENINKDTKYSTRTKLVVHVDRDRKVIRCELPDLL